MVIWSRKPGCAGRRRARIERAIAACAWPSSPSPGQLTVRIQETAVILARSSKRRNSSIGCPGWVARSAGRQSHGPNPSTCTRSTSSIGPGVAPFAAGFARIVLEITDGPPSRRRVRDRVCARWATDRHRDPGADTPEGIPAHRHRFREARPERGCTLMAAGQTFIASIISCARRTASRSSASASRPGRTLVGDLQGYYYAKPGPPFPTPRRAPSLRAKRRPPRPGGASCNTRARGHDGRRNDA